MLGVTPAVYYDLTGPETEALLKGAVDKELNELRRMRTIATLLHNAHFANPQPDYKFMPLPGDEERIKPAVMDPEVAFALLGSMMGGTLTEEITA